MRRERARTRARDVRERWCVQHPMVSRLKSNGDSTCVRLCIWVGERPHTHTHACARAQTHTHTHTHRWYQEMEVDEFDHEPPDMYGGKSLK